jgi:uncharacterized integral membrane protein
MKAIKKFINLLFILACISYLAFFSYLNVETIYVHFPYIGEFRLPAAVAFLCTFIAGAVFSGFYFLLDTAKKSMEIKRNRKELYALRREEAAEAPLGNIQSDQVKLSSISGERP